MEINVLEEYISLVETCSFQETSAVMNISQSSLTKHIHKLEEELNLSLFDRSTRTVKSNEYSRVFYPFAKNIVELYHESLNALDELNDKEKNQFTVTYMPVLGQYGLVNTLAAFEDEFPSSNINTVECIHPIEFLRTNRCDFAFVDATSEIDEKFNKMVYKSDCLAVVLPEEHPLCAGDSVTIEQLFNEKFIIHTSHNTKLPEETQKFFDLCSSRNFEPRIAFESQYTATMLRLVMAGRGIAVLNRLRVPESPGLKILPFYPAIRSYVYMIYRRKLHSQTATDFLHYMIQTINE